MNPNIPNPVFGRLQPGEKVFVPGEVPSGGELNNRTYMAAKMHGKRVGKTFSGKRDTVDGKAGFWLTRTS